MTDPGAGLPVPRASEYIQVAVARVARLVGRANYQDSIAFKETGTWGQTQLEHDLSEDLLVAQVRLQWLSERARDDELRKLITGFSNRGHIVPLASSKEGAYGVHDVGRLAARMTLDQSPAVVALLVGQRGDPVVMRRALRLVLTAGPLDSLQLGQNAVDRRRPGHVSTNCAVTASA